MSEENKALARKFFRMLELGDPNTAEEIVTVDYYNHDAPDPNIGLDGIKAAVKAFKDAFPDARVNIAYQVAEGDKVVSRYKWSGTHQGEFYGVPATGKQVSWSATATFRVADGRIREAWLNTDRWGVMEQLGMVKTPGE